MPFMHVAPLNKKLGCILRIEPRCRKNDFSNNLKGEIRDPLWMLARQWQLGEFKGEDAGSPVEVNAKTKTALLTRCCLDLPESGLSAHVINETFPLESLVEHEATQINWRTRVWIGHLCEKELRKKSLWDKTKDKLLEECMIDPLSDDDYLVTDDDTRNFVLAVAKRVLDGKKLLDKKILSENSQFSPPDSLNSSDKDAVKEALMNAYRSYQKIYPESESKNPAWHAEEFGYKFSLAAPSPEGNGKQEVLVAPQYRSGEMDWHTFSVRPNSHLNTAETQEPDTSVVQENTIEMTPMNITFKGMPKSRWWTFEDSRIDFGNLNVNTSELGKLIVMEFAIVYSNDWFVIPCPLPVGSLCWIEKLEVKNVFGETQEIKPAGGTEIDSPQKPWNMFKVSLDRDREVSNPTSEKEFLGAEDFLFLPPTLAKREEAPALEEVHFVRDEMANMVWAIERTVSSGLGQPMDGYEGYLGRRRRAIEKHNRERAASIAHAAKDLGNLGTDALKAAELAASSITPESLASNVEEAARKLSEAEARSSGAVNSVTDEEQTKLAKYHLASEIPGNWIPYLPVHTGSNKRRVQLEQAKVLHDSSEEIEASIVCSLLLKMPAATHLNEEAISRSGIRLQLVTQRARWIDGSTHVWKGWTIRPGRGEGSSGLRFDYLTEE